MKKLTNQEFLARLHKKSPNIEALEPYVNRGTAIRVRCKVCQYEWTVIPHNIYPGYGCPKCDPSHGKRKKITADEFVDLLSNKNPDVEVVDKRDFVNITQNILAKCKKCGYIWNVRPKHLLEGHGCPACGGATRKSDAQFKKELSAINPMIEPLKPYISAKTKILCRCKYCLNTWSVTPDKLLQGAGCSFCDKRNKTSFPEQSIYYYLKDSFPNTLNRYLWPNTKVELDVFVPEIAVAIEYDGVYWHRSKKTLEKEKYELCKSQGIKLVRIREFESNNLEVSDTVIVRNKPYNFKTLDDALKELFVDLQVDINVDTLRDSASIRKLYYSILKENSLEARYPDLSKEWDKEKNGAITPKMVSYGCNDPFWWKCPDCGQSYLATVTSRTNRDRGCPECWKIKLSEKFKKDNDVFVKELAKANPNLEPLEEYKTTHENIMIRCKRCGYEWPAAPANLLRGRDCPKCSRKRGTEKMKATKRAQAQQKKNM